MSTGSKKVNNQKSSISNTTWLALAMTLSVVGWSGLYYLVTHAHPTSPARLLFLALWAMAWLGTAWPVLLAINQRLTHRAFPIRVWRQSGWVAALGTLSAWLQMDRALTLPLVVTMAGMFGLLETLLILREREEAKREEANNDADQ